VKLLADGILQLSLVACPALCPELRRISSAHYLIKCTYKNLYRDRVHVANLRQRASGTSGKTVMGIACRAGLASFQNNTNVKHSFFWR
jgi:hypothetical protein